MASFVPCIPAAGARRGGPDVVADLSAGARHAGSAVTWLPLSADGVASFTLASPARSICRTVAASQTLPGGNVAGPLIELSPLPVGGSSVLRRLPGYPTFYIGWSASAAPPPDDTVVEAGEPLATTADAVIGVLFDDRVALDASSWMQLIGDAMSGVDFVAEVAAWNTMNRFGPPARSLRVLDHVGRPAIGQTLRVTAADGSVVTSAVTADGSVALPAGEVLLSGATPGTVLAWYEGSLADPTDRASSTPPGGSLTLPASAADATVQLIDASAWFAERPAQLDAALGHVHPDSRLEPLIDGVETFAALLEDLLAATGVGNGAHFSGWAFNDFPLDLDDVQQTMFTDLIRALDNGNGARFLMDQYLVLKPDAPTDVIEQLVIVVLTAGVDVLLILGAADVLDFDDRGYFALGVLTILISLAVLEIGMDTLLADLMAKVDGSKVLAEVMNQIRPGIALRARHPARFVDNALEIINPLAVDPSQFVDGVSSWHQKSQVIRRSPDALGNRVVGYVGGIDMNRNRLDTPGHHGRSWRPPESTPAPPSPVAFHDVHARITGPAAADVAHTFATRWDFEAGRQPPGSPPQLGVAFATPAATDTTDVPPQPARHLVQVCRSGYTPNPSGGSEPLPWSPLGEATIPEAIERAIASAREYIYIEDQYFTPHDSYISALLDASTRPNMRLLIIVPTASDQLFGDIRRREMFERLRDDPATGRGWGDRMIVGALVRRPVLAHPGRVTSKGRLRLMGAIPSTGGQQEITLGPRARIPGKPPFWLWVEGEQMLSLDKRDDVMVEGIPATKYLIQRADGALPLWGAMPRTHAAGAPVTCSQTQGIYVHTKAIIVDDVFVGIGSCNTNRRGFFHDGEITAFAVPEQLKAARENPARSLRVRLWAEHLGLPSAMGDALLADPLAAFEMFRRPVTIGNRVTPFHALGVKPELGFPSESATWMKMLSTFLLTTADALVPYVWNVFSDPPSASDPDPRVGPKLGTV